MVTNGNRNPNGSGTPTRMEGGSSSETAGGEPYDHPMMIDGVEHDMHGMAYDHDGVVRNRRRYNMPTTTGAEYGGDMDDDGWDGDDDSMVRSGMRGSMRGGMDSEGRMGRMARYGGKKRGSGGQGGAEHEIVPMYIPVPMEVGGQGRSRGKSSGGVDLDELGSVGVDTIALINNVGTQEGESEMFGSGTDNGFLAGLLAGGGANRGGVDPTLAYLNNCKDSGMWGGDSLALIILLLLLGAGRGGFGNGFGGNGSGCCDPCGGLLSEKNTGLVLDAVGTNGIRQEAAINALAGNLNCDVNSIKSTLCTLAQNQAVMSGDLKSAIQACCCNLQGKIDSCCCTTNNNIARESAAIQLGVERQGCDIKSELAGINYNLASQFAAQNSMMQMISAQHERQLADCCCDMRQQMQAGFDALAKRELEQEIQRLRDERDNQRTSAQTAFLLQAFRASRPFTGNLDATTGDFTGLVASQTGQFTI